MKGLRVTEPAYPYATNRDTMRISYIYHQSSGNMYSRLEDAPPFAIKVALVDTMYSL